MLRPFIALAFSAFKRAGALMTSPLPPPAMSDTPGPSEALTRDAARLRAGRFIYLAGPGSPRAGGMFRTADYLVQGQALDTPAHSAQLRPLDTCGAGTPASSLAALLTALAHIVRGRLRGELAGVHVHIAGGLSVLRKGVIVAVCRAIGVPVLLHLHAAQVPAFYAGLPLLLQALTRGVFQLANAVVVLGDAAREFVTWELRVPAGRVEVVSSGVPEPGAVRRVRQPDEPQRVLFLGKLSERKGVSDLLQALADPGFRSLPVTVTLAGAGDLAGYQGLAQSLGVAHRVQLAGWCDAAQAARLMAQADVLVLPSYDEGLPLAILEALGNGVAVVCTPVGEIPGVLTDGVDALFVPPGDTDALAARLQDVLLSPVLREWLERNGRACHEEKFSLPQFFDRIARVHRRTFGIAAQPAPTDARSRPRLRQRR